MKNSLLKYFFLCVFAPLREINLSFFSRKDAKAQRSEEGMFV